MLGRKCVFMGVGECWGVSVYWWVWVSVGCKCVFVGVGECWGVSVYLWVRVSVRV